MSELIYNGLDFSTLFTYGDPQITILDAKPDLREASSRNGAAFVGMTYGVSTVAVKLAALGDAATRRAAFSTLGKYLMVDEPKALYLPDTPDRYYLAVLQGGLDLTRGINGELTTLTFALTDPVAYGETKSATVSSDLTYLYATIGGTAPTRIDVTCSDAAGATSGSYAGEWSIGYTGYSWKARPRFDLGSDGTTHSVEISSSKRYSKVDGTLTPMDIQSDWLIVEPSTLRKMFSLQYGTGTFTITWTERWY